MNYQTNTNIQIASQPITKRCILCGKPSITILEQDKIDKTPAYFSWIRTKYCCSCADTVYRENNRMRQQRFRTNRKKVNKLKDNRLSQLTEYSSLLVQENKKLQDEIDMLRNRLYT